MRIRIPLSLTKKRVALQYEKQELQKRLAQLIAEIEAIDYAIKIVAPGWVPPAAPAKRPPTKSRLPHGAVAETCLELLRDRHEASTGQITESITKRFGLELKTKTEQQDLASAIAMALRRFERKGVVEVTGRDRRTGQLRWRWCAASNSVASQFFSKHGRPTEKKSFLPALVQTSSMEIAGALRTAAASK